ncbi:MAG: hypothetical protein QF632_04770 [Candidatus Woesearchaeota archaeon]|jgi:hypothetical protein|nr:hypothetical protein [Candidatus Woesearchaeota archaeon]MDP7324045.1 hypothetical protein [Candidatus Woesearchaeota archaeon]MDP7457394.1 hypothetical protein [Candidatus Woesearchaeota archaeon]|tara:strand:+ start:390 stop:863 length:474 start_codon:yes stop_codon:yes gene_type:complete
MRSFEEYRKRAVKNLHIADHMIYMTYNVVKDPKILVSIMENVFLAASNAITAVLHFEYTYKNIPSVPEGFETKFMLFKHECAEKCGVDASYLKTIRMLKDTIIEHRTSPVEFRRKDKYVICGDNYKMKVIGIEDIKEYIRTIKEFMNLTDNILLKNA